MTKISIIQFNGSNAFEISSGEYITTFPMRAVGFENIAFATQVFTSSPGAGLKVTLREIGATGNLLREQAKNYAPTEINLWQRMETFWPAHADMAKAEVRLEAVGGTVLIAQPKVANGMVTGAYATNFAPQLSKMSPTGIYTGTITAHQVILVDKDSLSNRLVTINNALLSLQDRDNEISTDITAQGLTVTSNKQGINANTNRIESLNTSLGTQILKLGELDKKTGELGLSIETIRGDVSTHKSSLSSMSLTISSLGRRTDTNENKIQGLETSTAINLDQIRDAHRQLESTQKTVDSHATTINSYGAKITSLETKEGVLSSSISNLTAGNLTLSTNTKGVIGSFTVNSNYLISTSPNYEVRLSANSSYNAIHVYDKGNNRLNFSVGHNGHLYARSANITGNITAERGTIGGFNIDNSTLKSTNGSYGVQITGYSGGSPIWVGNSSFTNSVFQVSWQGKMTAKDADIEGEIKAKSGTIGGFNITGMVLESKATGSNYIRLSGSPSTHPILVGGTDYSSATFAVSSSGVMKARGASIEGDITATTGSIGGFNIQSNTLESGSTSGTRYVRITGNANLNPIQIMRNGNMMFFVDTNGKLTAKDADITGKISANEGTIGGWNLNNSFIDSKNGSARVFLASHADVASTFLGITDSNGVSQFSVSKQGHLIANSATIKGTLQAGSIINGQLNNTSGTHTGYTTGRHSGSLYNVDGTYTGNLVNTKGTHTGYTTGQHSGSLYSTNGNHAGSLTNTTGSHNGGVYSSTGSLGGSGYTVGANGRLNFNSGISINGTTTIDVGLRVFGNVVYSGTLTQDSDERLKQDIEDIPQNIVDEIMNVKIKRFGYKTNPNEKHFGVIAQDLISDTSRDMSDVLVKPYEGYFTVAYEQFVPLLIKLAQDQEKRIKELEEKIA